MLKLPGLFTFYWFIPPIVILIGQWSFTHPQTYNKTHLKSTRTLSSEQEKFRNDLINNSIEKIAELDFSEQSTSRWCKAFWAMELLRYRDEFSRKMLCTILQKYTDLAESLQKASLEASFALYPGEFIEEFRHISQLTTSAEHFALAVSYITRKDSTEEIRQYYQKILEERFPGWVEQPVLYMLHGYLRSHTSFIGPKPPLIDLMKHPYLMGKPVFFCFQRHDRSFPGITIFRKSNGKVLKDDSGKIWAIPHLALSLSGMPSYIKNGDSPQGIYSLQGILPSDNIFIGPSPTLQLVLPFEVTSNTYFHGSFGSDSAWSIRQYESLLPASWNGYLPVYEAYYAGMAGRSEIIAHGSTINPAYYLAEPFYPMTPSLGCLTSKEIWSETNGSCLYSDQIELINVYLLHDGKNGFLILLNLDYQKKAVTIEDLPPEILSDQN